MTPDDIAKLEKHMTEKIEAFLASGGALICRSYGFKSQTECCPLRVATMHSNNLDFDCYEHLNNELAIHMTLFDEQSFFAGYDGLPQNHTPQNYTHNIDMFKLGVKMFEKFPPKNKDSYVRFK